MESPTLELFNLIKHILTITGENIDKYIFVEELLWVNAPDQETFLGELQNNDNKKLYELWPTLSEQNKKEVIKKIGDLDSVPDRLKCDDCSERFLQEYLNNGSLHIDPILESVGLPPHDVLLGNHEHNGHKIRLKKSQILYFDRLLTNLIHAKQDFYIQQNLLKAYQEMDVPTEGKEEQNKIIARQIIVQTSFEKRCIEIKEEIRSFSEKIKINPYIMPPQKKASEESYISNGDPPRESPPQSPTHPSPPDSPSASSPLSPPPLSSPLSSPKISPPSALSPPAPLLAPSPQSPLEKLPPPAPLSQVEGPKPPTPPPAPLSVVAPPDPPPPPPQVVVVPDPPPPPPQVVVVPDPPPMAPPPPQQLQAIMAASFACCPFQTAYNNNGCYEEKQMEYKNCGHTTCPGTGNHVGKAWNCLGKHWVCTNHLAEISVEWKNAGRPRPDVNNIKANSKEQNFILHLWNFCRCKKNGSFPNKTSGKQWTSWCEAVIREMNKIP